MSKKRKVLNLESCRLCLRKVNKVNLKSIFEDEFKNLSDIIFECTSIFVSPDDNLPQKICINCEALLNIVTEFKATCLTANQLLVEGKNTFQDAKDWLCEDNKINLRRTEKLISKSKKEMDDFYSIATQEIKIEQDGEFEMVVKPELLVPEVNTSEELYENLKEPELEEKKQKAKKLYASLMVPCHICGKLQEKHIMKYHLNVHNEIRPFACDKEGCKKAFYNPKSLRKHVKEVHSDEMKAICTICGKRFKTKYYLKDHLAYHQDVEPTEPCAVCGKLYRDKKAVREHMIWHREEKFQCEVCKKKFKVAKNLRIHMRIHTNEKPYPCDQCNMKFAYNCLLKTHKEKCH